MHIVQEAVEINQAKLKCGLLNAEHKTCIHSLHFDTVNNILSAAGALVHMVVAYTTMNKGYPATRHHAVAQKNHRAQKPSFVQGLYQRLKINWVE
jgi:hypothetical protein